MHRRRPFPIDDLKVIENATHEPIILGDFVRLASGSPLGLVISAENDLGYVAWLTGTGLRSSLPLVCLRPAVS